MLNPVYDDGEAMASFVINAISIALVVFRSNNNEGPAVAGKEFLTLKKRHPMIKNSAQLKEF